MDVILGNQNVPVQRIFCTGMNYREHIKELDSKTPETPVIFMKPATSLVGINQIIPFAKHGNDFQFETEIVLLIGREGYIKNDSEALDFISGISVGFDLTLRDLQKKMKDDGLPWEISKSFDYSAPIGKFTPYTNAIDIHNIDFSGYVNGQLRQSSNSGEMIFSPEKILRYIGSIWKLLPGDLVFTGTPPGVGAIKITDTISVSSPVLKEAYSWSFR